MSDLSDECEKGDNQPIRVVTYVTYVTLYWVAAEPLLQNHCSVLLDEPDRPHRLFDALVLSVDKRAELVAGAIEAGIFGFQLLADRNLERVGAVAADLLSRSS